MEPASQIRAVIFDMDGVLTDSEPLINDAAVRMFRERGLQAQPADFLPFVGTGEDRYIGGVAEKYGFAIDLAAAKKRTYEIYLELVPERLAAFPGAVDLVRACRKAGLKISVASSADRVKIEANLRQIGLPPSTWDAIVCAEDVALKKPAPDIFLAAARKLGLAPHECVVIEDAVNGVQAAKAAGMRCIAVAQTFPPDKLRMADLVKPSIADVSLADLGVSIQYGLGSTRALACADRRLAGRNVVESQLLKGDSSGRMVRSAGAPTTAREGACAPRLLPDCHGLDACQVVGGPGGNEEALQPWGFWATLGLSLAIAAANMIAQLSVLVVWSLVAWLADSSVSFTDLADSGLMLAVATCAGLPVIVGLAWLFASYRPTPTVRDYLGMRPVAGRTVFRWCLGLSVLIISSDGLTSSLGRPIVPEFMTQAYRTAGFVPLLWLAVIVAAPIGEEILFRGFLYQGLARSPIGGWGAIIVGSGVWAVVHLQYDWYGMASIFIGGLLLGYSRLKTGSLYPAIVMHAVMNCIATIQVAVQEHFFRA